MDIIDHIGELLQRPGARRLMILALRLLLLLLLIAVLYLLRSLLDLLLFTFIIAYLMYRAQQFLNMYLRRVLHVEQKMMFVILYVVLAGLFVYGLYRFVPELYIESAQVLNQIVNFYNQPHDNQIIARLLAYTRQIILYYYYQAFGLVSRSFWRITVRGWHFFLAVVLSLYFLLERNRVIAFTARLESSKISGLYLEMKHLGIRFMRSFGKVIEAQVVIAFINCVLSVIALWIMGFPHVLGLGIMILVLGLAPIAGVFISLIPLSIIAFSIGGIMKVVAVLILIAVLHALEGYVLNPRLMSSRTNLPLFYILLALIISEHFLGLWGLFIGIPILMFILDLLGVSTLE